MFALTAALIAARLSGEVAPTPPMGWNSYDCFGYSVNESQFKANADYEARHLKKFGWQYAVVDFVWSAPTLGLDVPWQNAEFDPKLTMDAYGRLLPDPVRFPSSVGGKGFKPLADYCHKRGLKFGIHLMRGIPRQAVAAKTPIRGSRYTAADAADVTSTCPWLNHMFGLNMSKPAGQEYLNSILKLYKSWGVDFVKVDDISRPYHRAEIEGYRRAIDVNGRPMVLSLSPGETPIEDSESVAKTANMWRLVDDLWDNWPQLVHAAVVVSRWDGVRGPGHWPDIDMLPLGKLRVYGPTTGPPNSYSRFTQTEEQTLMTMMCITESPLMFGGDLPQTDSFVLALITNPEALAVNQKATGVHTTAAPEGLAAWESMGDRGEKYVGVLNLTDGPVSFFLSKDSHVRDLWLRKDLPAKTASLLVPPHGSYLLSVKSR